MALPIQNPDRSRQLQEEGKGVGDTPLRGVPGTVSPRSMERDEGAPTGADLLTVPPSLRPPNSGNSARGTNFERSWLCRKSRRVSAARQSLAPLETGGAGGLSTSRVGTPSPSTPQRAREVAQHPRRWSAVAGCSGRISRALPGISPCPRALTHRLADDPSRPGAPPAA